MRGPARRGGCALTRTAGVRVAHIALSLQRAPPPFKAARAQGVRAPASRTALLVEANKKVAKKTKVSSRDSLRPVRGLCFPAHHVLLDCCQSAMNGF